MSYHSSKYDNQEWSKPRSHSPPSQSYQSQYTPPYYQKTKPRFQKWTAPDRKRYSSNANHRPYHWRPNNNTRRFHNNFNDQGHLEGKSASAAYERRSLSISPLRSPEKLPTKQDDSYVNSYRSEALQTYETDRNTITEVTQMLINEDKDLEERLLRAMGRILITVKQKHEDHLELLERTNKK